MPYRKIIIAIKYLLKLKCIKIAAVINYVRLCVFSFVKIFTLDFKHIQTLFLLKLDPSQYEKVLNIQNGKYDITSKMPRLSRGRATPQPPYIHLARP